MKVVLVLFFMLGTVKSFALTTEQVQKIKEYCSELPKKEQRVNKYCLKVNKYKLKSKKLVKKSYSKKIIVENNKFKKKSWNLYLTGTVLGNIKGVQVELSHRWQKIETGLFYRTIDRQNDSLDLKVKGNNYGLSLRYHFLSLKYTSKFWVADPAIYLKIGKTSLDNPITGEDDSYLQYTIGADVSYPLFKFGTSQVKGYSHLGLHYVNNSEEGNLYFGSDLGLGLLLEF